MYTRFILPFASTLAALSLVTFAPAAHAQTFITTNTTLNASNSITGAAFIGYANFTDLNNQTNPASPTVSLVGGGFVFNNGGGDDVSVYNNSVLNVSGGLISGRGGSRFAIAALDNTTINIGGGSITGGVELLGTSILNISGGNFNGDLNGIDSTVINIFGTSLRATLVNANNAGRSQFSVSGNLADGTILVNQNLFLQNGSAARFTLNTPAAVPEPGSIALLVGITMTGAGFLSRRRKVAQNAA